MPFLKLVFEKRKLQSGETPEVVFDHLQGRNSFLLQSVAGGRYSYIGYDPLLVCTCHRGTVFVEKKRSLRQIIEGDPLEVLRGLFKQMQFRGKSPVPFFGGAAGFFSYDFGAKLVDVELKTFDDLSLPDFIFCFVDKVIAFDHQKNEIFFLATAETDLQARRKIEQIKNDLNAPVPLISSGEIGRLESNLSFAQYEKKIAEIKEYLQRGETYQVNFSQRFRVPCTLDSWQIYKRLSAKNPAPFSCYFDFDDFQIISSSPELLLRKKGSQVETWPIKGTVSKGANEKEDEFQIAALLASEKNQAELSMIVDLERNDLGKVCQIGSVKVESHREIQKLSHVIHTISRISGKLVSNKDFFDIFRALFPGGSITGCPKKRTMEIIDRLEDFRRGIYTGSAGFISFSGDSDMNILIRTMLKKRSNNSSADMLYFQAGGGIVIDSDAKSEYEESLKKVEGLRASLE
jgi:para-aminobenzoate synthetase component 1